MIGDTQENHDSLIHARDNSLKRVSETHPSYYVLQYPLILWSGQDGGHFTIPQIQPAKESQLQTKGYSQVTSNFTNRC